MNFKSKCQEKIIKIKQGLLNLPHKLSQFIKNTSGKIISSFKMIPKAFKYSWKNTIEKIKNLPQRIKKFGLTIYHYKWADYKRILIKNAIFIALIILIIYIIIVNNSFLTIRNITNIINQSAVKLLVALGVGTIIVARGTDLSAGRVVGLTAFIGALASQNLISAFSPNITNLSPLVPIILSMLCGAAVGLVNGIIVAKFNVTPFIATLGTMLIAYGLNQYLYSEITQNQPVGNLSDQYTYLANEGIKIGEGTISWLAIIALAVAFLMYIIWTKLPWGRKLFAVGGNPQAAAVSGIGVSFVLIVAYVIGGSLYGLAGTFEAWRSGSVTSNTGNMYELDAIAAAIVGGLSFDGGKGKISGIIIGVILFQTITYGFAYIGVNSAITFMIKGVIIVIAVAVDSLKNRVKV